MPNAMLTSGAPLHHLSAEWPAPALRIQVILAIAVVLSTITIGKWT